MNSEKIFQVLLAPHITEKSSSSGDAAGQIAFKVASDATKSDIKQAVETLFGVHVRGVSVLNVKGKSKRFGARYGKRSGWKKAYVSLAPGQEIDFSQTVSATN